MKIKKFVKKNRRKIVIWACLIVGVFWLYSRIKRTTTNAAARQGIKELIPLNIADNQFFLQLLILYPENINTYRAKVSNMRRHGYNLFSLPVHFYEVLKPDGSFDFTKVDERIDIAVSEGVSVNLSLFLSLYEAQMYEYRNMFNPNDFARNQSGEYIEVNNGAFRHFCISSNNVVNQISKLCKALAERYEPYRKAGYIQFVTPRLNVTGEYEYSHTGQSDFSPTEAAKYGQPIPTNANDYNYQVFKSNNLGNLMDKICEAFSGYKVISEHGSAFDGIAKFRGTFGFRRIGQKAAAYKINGPEDVPYFHKSIIKSCAEADGKIATIEHTIVDGNNNLNTMIDLCVGSINFGFKMISVAFGEGSFDPLTGQYTPNQIAVDLGKHLRDNGYISTTRTAQFSGETVSRNLADILAQNGYDGGMKQEFLSKYSGNRIPPKVYINS